MFSPPLLPPLPVPPLAPCPRLRLGRCHLRWFCRSRSSSAFSWNLPIGIIATGAGPVTQKRHNQARSLAEALRFLEKSAARPASYRGESAFWNSLNTRDSRWR